MTTEDERKRVRAGVRAGDGIAWCSLRVLGLFPHQAVALAADLVQDRCLESVDTIIRKKTVSVHAPEVRVVVGVCSSNVDPQQRD